MEKQDKPSFNYGRTFVVGFGFLGISIIWPIFNQFIPLFLQAGNPAFEAQLLAEGRELPNVVGFGLAPAAALFIMTWDNLINVFVQPWVGARSDRTWNRFGRRKPWILLGLPLALTGFILIPLVPPRWGTAGVLAIAAFILLTNFGMALFRSPVVAWLGDLFLPEDRSKANGIINLMAGIGTVLALVVGGLLYDLVGRTAPFIAGAALLLVACGVAIARVREPRRLNHFDDGEPAAETSVKGNLRRMWHTPGRGGLLILLAILFWFMAYEALNTGLSSFAVFTLGIPAGLAATITSLAGLAYIAGALPAGLLGSRYGRRAVILTALVGLTILFFGSYFLIQDTITFAFALILTGLLWAAVNVNSLPLVYDFGDERHIGAFTGLYYFSSQSASVLGPTLGGVMVDLLGDQYRWLFLFSTFFMALAWIAMKRLPKQS